MLRAQVPLRAQVFEVLREFFYFYFLSWASTVPWVSTMLWASTMALSQYDGAWTSDIPKYN